MNLYIHIITLYEYIYKKCCRCCCIYIYNKDIDNMKKNMIDYTNLINIKEQDDTMNNEELEEEYSSFGIYYE